MRIFEWGIFIWIFFLGYQLLFKEKLATERFLNFSLGGLLLFSIGQITIEGYRWQIIPLYILVFGLIIYRYNSFLKKNLIMVSKISFVLLILVNLISIILLPMPKLPAPTGKYGIGTRDFYLEDKSREEIYGEGLNPHRELMVQVWYPVNKSFQGKYVPWMPQMPYFSPEIGERFGIPGFMLEHLIFVKSHSISDAAISLDSSTYPVILFSHGWAGFKEQNIYQVEELASHGYIVIAVNHTYGAMMTVFPDGRSFPRDRSALPEGVTDEEYYIASNKLVRQWADDLKFVLGEFEIMNVDPSNLFYKKLELDKIGVMGHSTGGGAAVEFCFENTTCGAFLGMDPWLEPVTRDKLSSGHSEPMLLMFSEDWASVPENEGNQPPVQKFVSNSIGWVSEMVISETMHFDFSITPVISPLTEVLGFKGNLDGDRILEIINTYSLEFFGKFLNFTNSTLLDGNSVDYPEVLFSVK